jgi:hypothetical protein
VDSPAPVFPFIVARGRSGTTLLRAILDAHPDLAIPGESHFPLSFARNRDRYERPQGFDQRRYLADLTAHWGFQDWDLAGDLVSAALAEAEPRDLADAIRLTYAVYAERHGKRRFGDKTPGFVMHIDRLARFLPEARFVHLIRDGRDVALSYLATDFGASTLGDAALYWDRFVRAGRASGERLGPRRYLEIRYEELVERPSDAISRLCGFIDIDFDPVMLDYSNGIADLFQGLPHREHHRNLFLPPTKGLRNWRKEMAPRDVAQFEAIAGPLLSELGYERAFPRSNLDARAMAIAARLSLLSRQVGRRVSSRVPFLRPRQPVSLGSTGIAAEPHSEGTSR